MKQNTVKLNESQLKKVVTEAVKRVLSSINEGQGRNEAIANKIEGMDVASMTDYLTKQGYCLNRKSNSIHGLDYQTWVYARGSNEDYLGIEIENGKVYSVESYGLDYEDEF